MSYVKAAAEVVKLDVQDVVRTSYGYQAVEDLFNNLQDGPREALSSILLNPNDIQGLMNMLNDLDETRATALFNLLSSPNQGAEYAGTVMATIESLRLTLICDDASHHDVNRYSADEEADSFDSEW